MNWGKLCYYADLWCVPVGRTAAMDEAAKNGHIDVVKFLHSNRQEGCTGGAMDMASRNGHLEVRM